jgi:radical SAM/Cys-rich protein
MARSLRPDLNIIDRCNLTVFQEPGQQDLMDFLKEQRVHVIASVPCYSAENVNPQRGSGVFERSIAALLVLNDAGFGTSLDLKLDLVYNPLRAFLPPRQDKLKVQYKEQLSEHFGVLFNQLFMFNGSAGPEFQQGHGYQVKMCMDIPLVLVWMER